MRGCIQEAESLMHCVPKFRKKFWKFSHKRIKSSFLEILSNRELSPTQRDRRGKINYLLQKKCWIRALKWHFFPISKELCYVLFMEPPTILAPFLSHTPTLLCFLYACNKKNETLRNWIFVWQIQCPMILIYDNVFQKWSKNNRSSFLV